MYFLAVEHMTSEQRQEFDNALNGPRRQTLAERAALVRQVGGEVR